MVEVDMQRAGELAGLEIRERNILVQRFPAFSTSALKRMLEMPGSAAPNETHAARIRETIAAREKKGT